MKIAQLTDLHIDREGEFPFDIDVRKNFIRLLKTVREQAPEHLVITGDLCYREGEIPIYQWIKETLEAFAIPFSIIAGNHDDSVMMAQVFEKEHLLTGEEYFYAKKIGKKTCLFLDSGKGFHSKKQLNWLKRQLNNGLGDTYVFMHHPPVLAGVPFMDIKYPLQDITEIQKVLFSHSGNINIFCGHYHVEKTIRINNLMIQITPSCFFQIDQHSEEFKVDHHRIAYREIEIVNQHMTSAIKYFNGSKK